MDKLNESLKADAARIRVAVSDELDARINASLQGVEPELPAAPKPPARSFSFWLASSLTGIAAVAMLIIVANRESPELPVTVATHSTTPVANEPTEALLLNVETAVLTAPLQEELENLESDLKKAERAVREDLGLSL